ncbi:MAG: flagellar basal body P-ring formation chaperone FlgA, partial [Sphingomonas sp.]
MIRRLFAPAALALLVPAAATAAPAAPAEVPVAVLAHAVMAGDLLQASDFTPADRPAGLARGALDPRQAAGQEAARPIPAGSVVRSFDVRTPRLVPRGEPVMFAYHAGGITITTRGRALGG